MNAYYELEQVKPSEIAIELIPDKSILEIEALAACPPQLAQCEDCDVLITGRAPVWLYAAMSYHAVRSGCRSVSVHNKSERLSENWIRVFSRDLPPDQQSPGESGWFFLHESADDYVARLEMVAAPPSVGCWDPHTALKCIPAFHPNIESLTLTGQGSNWMYARAAASAAMAQIGNIYYDGPAEPGLYTIGLDCGRTVLRRTGNRKCNVIGVIGDPRSGKSILSRILEQLLRTTWPDAWMYDCDMASPTMRWYVRRFAEGDAEEAARLRDTYKKSWVPELELRVARQIRSLRGSLSLVVADLPGGKHSKIPGATDRPQRLPPGREVIMREIDAFVILARADNVSSIGGWRAELAQYNLEDRVIAEVISEDPQSAGIRLSLAHTGSILTGHVTGLDRGNMQADFASRITCEQLPLLQRYIRGWGLACDAKAACALSFLTKPSGTSYGSAVLTAEGEVFRAGQYSSFNHSTNVHAECAALLLSTMAGRPDVEMLAIASTDPVDVTRPCGVCRQVIMEHAVRISRSIDVVMHDPKGGVQIAAIGELLPFAWRLKGDGVGGGLVESDRVLPARSRADDDRIATGDHVFLKDLTLIGLVWDAKWDTSRGILVKLKYEKQPGGWRKFAHSFSEPFAYQGEVQRSGVGRSGPFGQAVVVLPSDIDAVCPCIPAGNALPEDIVELFAEAGIARDNIRITGSRALGLQQENSDYDLVIAATTEEIRAFQALVGSALAKGRLTMPVHSGTLRLFGQIYPGGLDAVLSEGRYAGTFQSDGCRVSILYVPKVPVENFLIAPESHPLDRLTVTGTVGPDDEVYYKRSRFPLQIAGGRHVMVYAYLKTANLLRAGDVVSLSGWGLQTDDRIDMLLLSGHRDRILWMQKNTRGGK
jgi:cytidine deaminase